MNERPTDFELLRNFTRLGDQEAFAIFVRRHLDLVYATALRKADDAGAAQEISQNVFTTLARKAWRFAPNDSLAAWLYKTTLLESKGWVRGELRRRRREQTAAELGTTMKTTDEQSAFRALVPLLDEALLSLREKDRTALLLRFYERQPLREMGASLGIGEDAAQKRVAAALEKVVHFFRSRGFRAATVGTTTAALQHTSVGAPTAVAVVVTQAAAHIVPVASGLTLFLARFFSLTQVQRILLCAVALSVPVIWRWEQIREARAEDSAREKMQTEAAANPAKASRVEGVSPPTEPNRQAAAYGTGVREVGQKEYSVHLTGFINTTDTKIAILEIRHHFFGRSNTPPLSVRKILTEGEAFDDMSVKGAHVHFELLQANFDVLGVRLAENGEESVYEIEGRSALPAEPRDVCLSNAGFDEVLDLYAALMGRTVLCHPQVKPLPIFAVEEASDRAAAVDALNRILLSKAQTATIFDGDKFALLVPTNLVKTVSTALQAAAYPVSTNETIPAGAINLRNVPLPQAMAIYAEFIGRTLIPSDRPLPRPVSLSFHNQTPLARAEAVYAFNILFGWQGLKAEFVNQNQFKMISVANR